MLGRQSILLLALFASVDSFATVAKSPLTVTKTNLRSTGLIRRRSVSSTSNSDNPTEKPILPADSSLSQQPMPDQFVTFIGKTASSFVSISFFVLLATRRDALMLTLFIGSIFNAVLSKVLKKLLNHERPENLQLNENIKLKPSDGGMVRICYVVFDC